MEFRKCIKGHYYDVSVHATCPYCEGTLSGYKADDEKKEIILINEEEGWGEIIDGNQRIYFSTGRTLADSTPTDLSLVGWLVCLNDSQKVTDYRIHLDDNYIGRSERMDICIKDDETISRVNHAVISYDERNNVFHFSPLDARSIVRVNNRAVFTTVELKAYDVITIGKTNLLFIPLCTEKFKWNTEE